MRPAILLALAAIAAAPALAQQSGTAEPAAADPAPASGGVADAPAAPVTTPQPPAQSDSAPETSAEPATKAPEDAAPRTAATPADKPANAAADEPAGEQTDEQTDGAAPTAAAEPATKPSTDGESGTAAPGEAAAGPLEFRTIVGDKPIEIPADRATPAFEQFRQTGENPFAGDEAALAEGKQIYAKLCQACHMPDGSGRIGPSLQDDEWRHPRLETQAGRFEIIHSGGAGAMQAFHNRLVIDEILKVMAWTDSFRDG